MGGDPVLTVACVLRSGEDFEPWMAGRLRDQVAANLDLEHRFVCLSDVDVPCERIPLETDWSGWFSKLELFRHDLGPTVYFDLDLAIVGDLSWIAGITEGFWGLRDPLWDRGWRMNSSMMGWTGSRPDILEGWSKAEERRWRRMPDRWGDQSWTYHKIGDQVRFIQDAYPGEVASVKFERGVEPRSVKLFSGRPRPWEVGY